MENEVQKEEADPLDLTPEALAAQLRHPHGEDGNLIAERLNESNAFITQFTYELMNVVDYDRILEIGFGNGKLLSGLYEGRSHLFVAGIDISKDMLREASEHNSSYISDGQMELRLASTEDIPFEDECFDKICSINTLYFWDNPLDEALEIYRVLKEGGQLFISIRSKEEAASFEFTKFGFNLFTIEEAEELFRKAGFAEVSHSSRPETRINPEGVEVEMNAYCIQAVK